MPEFNFAVYLISKIFFRIACFCGSCPRIGSLPGFKEAKTPIVSGAFLTPKSLPSVMPQLSIITMQFTCSSQVKLLGCIAPSDTPSYPALDRGVNRLSVFGGGEVSLPTAGVIRFLKSSLVDKKYRERWKIIGLYADCHL
jgi:hypothetical protein